MTRYRKSDIEFHYDHGRSRPAFNIKWSPWWPNIRRRWIISGHEFSGEPEFFEWADDRFDEGDDEPFRIADELARESCYEDAVEQIVEILGVDRKDVWQEGRCGGWLVIDDKAVRRAHVDCGYYQHEDLIRSWDAVKLAKWAKCQRIVDSFIRPGGECDYQFLWHLYVNGYETFVDERARQAFIDQRQGLPA